MVEWQMIAMIPLLGEGDTPVHLLIYGAVLLISVLGGILQKTKSKQQQEGKGATKPEVRPTGRRPAPPVRRTPVPPPGTRPGPQVEARPPTPIRARPAELPVARAPRPPADIEPPARPEVAAPEPAVEAEFKPLSELHGLEPTAAPVRVVRRPVSPVGRHLRAMLRSRSSLQAGVVLSEILAPPLALREERTP